MRAKLTATRHQSDQDGQAIRIHHPVACQNRSTTPATTISATTQVGIETGASRASCAGGWNGGGSTFGAASAHVPAPCAVVASDIVIERQNYVRKSTNHHSKQKKNKSTVRLKGQGNGGHKLRATPRFTSWTAGAAAGSWQITDRY